MFDVIPVIDVRRGMAVRAVAGDRANYQPLVSPLSATSDPRDVAKGLMTLHPFPVIYVADLDAIEGRGANCSMLQNLSALPRLLPFFSRNGRRWGETPDEGLDADPAAAVVSSPSSALPGHLVLSRERNYPALWADTGARSEADAAALLALPNVSAVIGSETGVTQAEMRALTARFGDEVILSLDFRGDRFMGDPALVDDPECWPSRVIAMTLTNVGRQAGPDLARIAAIKRRAGGRFIYAAGGVRHCADIHAARAAGASGALVSSALHAQTITADDLEKVTGR